MKPRVRDIAQAAGVSAATVSNVLNHKKGVSEQVAKTVLKIAEDMGYVNEPSREALPVHRCMRLVMYKRHGMVIMDTPFFAELVQGIERTCRNYGYELIVTSINRHSADVLPHIQTIVDDPATPFILLGTEMLEEDFAPFLHAKSPMLVLDYNGAAMDLYSVTLDNFAAGYTAGTLLLQAGHAQLGFATSSRLFQNAVHRRYGFECALRDGNRMLLPENYVQLEPTIEGAYRDMCAYLRDREKPLPTAYFAMNDIIAIGMSRALKEAGCRLPQDVSIIGVDDIPSAAVVSPPLTTMAVDKIDYGRAAVVHLIYAVRQHKPGITRPTTVLEQLKPILRRSVAAPPETPFCVRREKQ